MAGTNSNMIDDLLPPNPASMNMYWNALNEEFGGSLYPEIIVESGKVELPVQDLLFGSPSNDIFWPPVLFGDSSNDLLLQPVLYGDSSNDPSLQPKLFSDFSNDLFSQAMLFGASTSSSVGLPESMEREGFKAPKLVTTRIPLNSTISSSDIHPPLECSSVLSPSSSLDSPVFIPHSSAPESPTTGRFSFAKENLLKDIPHEIALKPPPESCSSFSTSENQHEVPSIGVPVKLEVPAHSGNIEGGNNCHNQQQFHLQSGSCVPSERKEANNTSKLDQGISSFVASDHPPAVDDQQGGETDLRDLSAVVDVPADSGYNWRKYGQKQVKGGEYPRSYYKCTHPGCNMKKKVERSSEGDITMIIYNGEHNHPKPNQNCQSCSDQAINGDQDRFGDGLETTSSARLGAENHDSLQLNQDGNNLSHYAFGVSSLMSNDEEGDQGGTVSLGCDGKGDETESKTRNLDACDSEMDASPEPIVVIRSTSNVDIMDDGYRWRKYGQKIVKGNQNPRSYYKCTNPGCTVRKQIERAKDDINAVLTTYEGKHNHDVPVARGGSHGNAAPSNAASKTAAQPRSLQRHEPTQDGLARFDGHAPPHITFGYAGREPLGATTSFPYTMGRPGSTNPPMAGLSPMAAMAMPIVPPIYPYGSLHQPTEAGGLMMRNVELERTPVPDTMLPLPNAAPVYPQKFLTRYPL